MKSCILAVARSGLIAAAVRSDAGKRDASLCLQAGVGFGEGAFDWLFPGKG